MLGTAADSATFNRPERISLRAALARSGEREINSHTAGPKVSSPPRTVGEVLRPAVCAAGEVVLGRVTGWTSTLSRNEGSVITLYTFREEAEFKTDGLPPAGPPSIAIPVNTLHVLWRGGSVRLPEGVIRQVDEGMPLLRVGADYVLFLRFFTGPDGYAIVDGSPMLEATIRTNGTGRLSAVRGPGLIPMEFESLDQFMASIQKALTVCVGGHPV